MPLLTKNFYELSQLPPTQHYIETGTYRGDGVKLVLGHYAHIYTIELSEHWAQYNQQQFVDRPEVHVLSGDSKQVLPELLKSIADPVTIYLDAHYSGGTTAFGEEETPLLAELDLLLTRSQPDIIIIDDCRLLGQAGTCGAGDSDPIYPTMNYDWRAITAETIVDRLKPNYLIVNNTAQLYTTGASDQIILYPAP